ncbi:hypothetical protein C0993_009883 [Termitomyces sp. T159_Od127]|nr:hypothetical protein C0993_009883 [Termitomyces sp. T159_Od127]
MSLINDTSYRIHQLRLSYLRGVDDIYGPRLISLDPAYPANPFIVAASLADTDRWPQLNMPASPQLTDDDHHPGARLKHTQTIMGTRSGALGMRIDGRRTTDDGRIQGRRTTDDGHPNAPVQNFVSPNAPVQNVVSSSMPVTSLSSRDNAVEPASLKGPAVFIPNFKGAKEMEKRRRARMAARAPAAPPQALDSDSSDDVPDDSSSDGVFDDGSMDDGDEFDFAQPDAMSSDWPHLRPRAASRLSPVCEDQKSSPPPRVVDPLAGTFDIVSPPRKPAVDTLFAKKKVPPIKPLKSALSSLLASADASSNPFSEMYAAVSGRGESASDDVIVYFPHATSPKGKPMELNVRKDATVEEVIGFSLWTYWSEGWQPRLDQGLSGESDPSWETKVSAVGWIVTKKAEKLTLPTQSLGASSSAILGSTLGSVPLSTSLGPSSSQGPPIFLRIRVADTADTVHISTTIPVSAGMYMQEALELVCRKRKLANPNDYALVVADMNILIPLDRTVASLQGKRELLLVKRSMLPQLGDVLKGTGKTTDPNAPMLLARQERTLAIDGVYIHVGASLSFQLLLTRAQIMPSTNKAMKVVFDSGKTSSYHIKSIVDCQQSAKTSSVFRLVLNRGGASKRYDFEAESPRLAGEIVQTIKSLKASLERSGTVVRSRRSRHVA